MNSRALNSEIQVWQKRFDTAKQYYVQVRAKASKALAQMNELREQARAQRREGNLAAMKELWEKSDNALTTYHQLIEVRDRAKGVADADLAKLKDLQAMAKRGGVLSPQFVEDFAKEKAHQEAVKYLLGKGVKPQGPALTKCEKRLYPGLLKHYKDLNQKGNL